MSGLSRCWRVLLPLMAVYGLTCAASSTGSASPREKNNVNVMPTNETTYTEAWRPQFHFSARKNWLNDPNGLVFYRGEYHLFFQHNPFGTEWGNMHWGHAVSKDLVHWKEFPIAIAPDDLGTVFSGSAVVDEKNTSGLQTGSEKVLVALYTAAPVPQVPGGPKFTQCLAYSNDRGRTWQKFAGNPVLKHVAADNRDPKVIWHAPTGKWVMALYLDGSRFALYASANLKDWVHLHDLEIPGHNECPDLFELPVDGDAKDTRWIFLGGNGTYMVGRFNGARFVPEAGPFVSDHGANFYATQSYSDVPPDDGRRIQLAWMRGGRYPEMPFNQQMSFPCSLTLHRTPDGIRMARQPVSEIQALRGKPHGWTDIDLVPGDPLLENVTSELFDIEAEIEPGEADEIVFDLQGARLAYRVGDEALVLMDRDAPLQVENGRISLRILVDRTSIEAFGNNGLVSLSSCFLSKRASRGLSLSAVGGTARVRSLVVYPLRTAWRSR